MRHYVRKADRIDKVRGDILMLRREDVEPLFDHLYPAETRRGIIDALLQWFAGGEEPRLKDPIINSYLQNLINKQKKSVQQYLDSCRVNADNRAQQRGATSVAPGATSVGNINKSKVNVKDERSESFTVTADGSGVDADATPAPSFTATASTALSPDRARQTIAVNAPPVTLQTYGEKTMKCLKESKYEERGLADADFIISSVLNNIGEKGNELTENAMRKFRGEIGADMFFRTWVRFAEDRNAAKDRGEPFTNPGALFMSRLKSIREALSVMPSGASAR